MPVRTGLRSRPAPGSPAELAIMVQRFFRGARFTNFSAFFGNLVNEFAGTGYSLSLHGGAAISTGVSLAQAIGGNGGASITDNGFSVGVALDVIGINITLGVQYDGDNGWDGYPAISAEFSIQIGPIVFKGTISNQTYMPDGSLGSAQISLLVGPGFDLGKGGIGRVAEFFGGSDSGAEANLEAGVLLQLTVKSEAYQYREVGERLNGWLRTTHQNLTAADRTAIWAEVTSNAELPLEMRIAMAIANRSAPANTGIRISDEIDGEVFGLLLRGAHNSGIGTSVNDNLTGDVRYDYERQADGSIIVHTWRVNALDNPIQLESGTPAGVVAASGYLTETYASFRPNATGGYDFVRNEQGRAKFFQSEYVVAPTGDRPVLEWPESTDRLQFFRIGNRILTSEFADERSQRHGSGINANTPLEEWNRLMNVSNLSTPVWRNWIEAEARAQVGTANIHLDASDRAFSRIVGPTPGNPVISSIQNFPNEQGEVPEDIVTATANAQPGSITIKKADGTEQQVEDQALWDALQAPSRPSSLGIVETAEKELDVRVGSKSVLNLERTEGGVAIHQAGQANGAVESRVVHVGDDGEVSTRITATRFAALLQTGRDDIIRRDSTGSPVFRGDNPIIDGYRDGEKLTVEHFTSGPLKGITRINATESPLGIEFGQAGAVLGNLLGKHLAGDDRLAQIATSALFKTIGQTLGEILDASFDGVNGTDISGVLRSFDENLFRNLELKAAGAVSTFLTKQLIDAVGLDGFVGEVLETGASELLRSEIANLVGIQTNNSLANAGNAVGALIGTKLASQVVTFGSVGGQLGSSVGSSIGSAIAGKLIGQGLARLGFLAGPVGALVGAFVGYLLGGLIGSVFGGTPRSGADVEWDGEEGRFAVTNVYSKKGGSKDAARSLADAAAQTFNAVLEASGARLADPALVMTGNYGMRKSDFVYRPTHTRDKDAITYRVSSKDKDAFAKITNHGIYNGLTDADFQLIGGDTYVKRAIYNTFDIGGLDASNFDSTVLLGNIASAQSYESYLANSAIINAIVAAEPGSVFAIETLINLARADELGLTRRHRSDWFGGYGALVEDAGASITSVEFGFDYDAYSGQVSRLIGVGDYVLGDSIDISGQTTIEAGTANDSIDLRPGKLIDQSGLTVDGALQDDIAVTDADFAGTSATLSFAVGERRKSVSVALTGDADSAVERFDAGLSNGVGVRVMGGAATATIVSDAGGLPVLMVGNSYAHEGDGYAVFRLSLSKAAAVSVSVDLAFNAGRASGGGVDFGGAGGGSSLEVSADGVNWSAATAATFAVGTSELFVRTAVIADNVVNPAFVDAVTDLETGAVITPANGEPEILGIEGNERFTLSVSVTAGAAVLANGTSVVTGTGTIVDGAGTEPLVWIDHVVVDEASGAAVFTVSRSGAAAGVGSVDFATSDRRELAIDIAATVDGGAGDDTIYASNLGDNIFSGEGNDTLYGGRLDDWLLGGAGNDALDAGTLDQNALGGDGNYLNGGAGDDVVRGREGSDWLEGGSGTDTLTGGAGDDILAGGAGAGDSAQGGSGDDQYLVRLDDGEDVAEEEATGAPVNTDAGDAITQRYAGIAAGTIKKNWEGTSAAVEQQKLAGGEDALVFGYGITLGDIQLVRSVLAGGGAGNDLIVRVMQTDPATGTESYSGTSLTVKDWFSDPFKRIEWLKFADGNEVRIGDITSFVIGGSGDDVLVGTNGNDFVYGGAGNDKLFLLGGDDIGNGGTGDDMVAGDAGRDLIIGGKGVDELIGGAGADAISGDDGGDDIYGGADNDILSGGRGDGDQLVGGAGDDIFKYARGDGRDMVFDDFSNNWDVVWSEAGGYNIAAGYNLNDVTGEVTGPNGQLIHGNVGTSDAPDIRWVGRFDYDSVTSTLRLFNPPIGAVETANAGTDTIEFAPGINIQDVILRRSGNDLLLAIGNDAAENADALALHDSVTIKDWYVAPGSIEKLAFYETGILDISAGTTNVIAGTDGADGTNTAALAGTVLADWITAGAGDDVVAGGTGKDIIAGNAGSDILRGEADDDVLYGGNGNDMLDGGAGKDVLLGGNGIDTASYASASTAVRVRLSFQSNNAGDNAGGDTFNSIENITGGSGADNLGGDAADNELDGGYGNDTLMGGDGSDTYIWTTGSSADVIREGVFVVEEAVTTAGVLADGYSASWTNTGTPSTSGKSYWRLEVHNAANELVYDLATYSYAAGTAMPAPAAWNVAGWLGGFAKTNGSQVTREKFDAAISGGDNDVIEFGPYISLSDLSFIRSSGGVADANGSDLIIRYGGNTASQLTIAGQYTLSGRIETLQFRDGLAVLLASVLTATSGAALDGSAGDDLLIGQDGVHDDILAGLDGDDVLSGKEGADQLDGGAGDDVLEGGAGADVLTGGANGAGGDTARYIRSTSGVIIDLRNTTTGQSGGDAAGDILNGIENIVGSQLFSDNLIGDDNANRIDALDGSNALQGMGGDDVLISGAGQDVLYGGTGNDNIASGDGNDRAWGGDGHDVLFGGAGDDVLRGEAGGDHILGGDGNDTVLDGGVGDDEIDGGAGNDSLTGGDGADLLAGGAGNDSLAGGAGDDVYFVRAGDGTDTIIDSEGANIVAFDAGISHDRLWLTQVGSDLRITVIGEDTQLTVTGFFAGTAPGLVKMIQTTSHAIYLDHPDTLALIAAMSAASAATPAAMPQAVGDTLARYWHVGGKAAPIAPGAARGVTTSEDSAITLDGSYGVVDHDQNITGYLLKEGAGPAKGVISSFDPVSGALTYTPYADANGSDQFVVIVTDADGHATELPVSMTITPVNDAPQGLGVEGGAALTLTESAPGALLAAGSVIGTFTSSDVDGDPVTYTLLDDAGGRFALTNEGELRLADPAMIDFEASTAHSIRIAVSDSNGGRTEQDYTVSVANANEANALPASYNFGVAENVALGTLVGSVAASDLDSADTLFGQQRYFFLNEGAASATSSDGRYRVDALTGAITTDAALNFEGGNPSASYTVIARDNAGENGYNQIQSTLSIGVADINEAPIAVAWTPASASIAERDRVAAGTLRPAIVLGTVSVIDPDSAGLPSADYALSLDDARFEIVGTTLRLREGQSLDYEASPSVALTISGSDRSGAPFSINRTITLSISDQDDVLEGGAGGDTLTGQVGRDLLYGYGGNDILFGNSGNDRLDGGDGADTLRGDAGVDRLLGGAGDDLLKGGEGDDNSLAATGLADGGLWGGDGNDVLVGGAGSDLIYGEGGDDLFIIEQDGGAVTDRHDGGAGSDTISYVEFTNGVTLNLATSANLAGEADARLLYGDIITSVENIIGSNFANSITGDALANKLSGGDGNDSLSGSFGDDVLEGGNGADTLHGDGGADTLIGGLGNDIIYGGADNDMLIGGDGDDQLYAEAGDDMLDGGTGNDILNGGIDNDTYIVNRSSGADMVYNYDPSGDDVDVIGFQDGMGAINDSDLWFERIGDNLKISVIGTPSSIEVANWYTLADPASRANHKIDFIVAGTRYSRSVNVEGLVSLMASKPKPATISARDALLADLTYKANWATHWGSNAAPALSAIATQASSEDMAGTISITASDDITPSAQVQVTAQVVAGSNVVNNDGISISAADANGTRVMTINPLAHASGTARIRVTAADAGGITTVQEFDIIVGGVADTPTVIGVTSAGGTSGGAAIALTINASFPDSDGSELQQIWVTGVPAGVSLSAGSYDSVSATWKLSPAELAGLSILAPEGWAEDLSLNVTARTSENGTAAISAAVTASVAINAPPSGASFSANVTENAVSGTALGLVAGSDPDVGDALSYSLLDSAGGRFAVSATGAVSVANAALLNFETATSHTIAVRITDSFGVNIDRNFVIGVANVNEANAMSGSYAFALNENVGVGTSVGSVAASDADSAATAFGQQRYYFWDGSTASGVSSDGRYAIGAGTGAITTNAAPNYESGSPVVTYTVIARDNAGASGYNQVSSNVTIAVGNLNEANSLPSSYVMAVMEYAGVGTTIGTVAAVDGDGSAVVLGQQRYYFWNGTTASATSSDGRYAIDAVSGAVKTNVALDYEAGNPVTSYTVIARDNAGGAPYNQTQTTITAYVNNYNEANSLPGSFSMSVNENVGVGTTVGAIAASDIDSVSNAFGQQRYYFWNGTAASATSSDGRFAIDAGTGAITTNAALNYESGSPSASYSVIARDNAGAVGYRQVQTSVTIAINDLNEEHSLSAASFTINETNSALGPLIPLGAAGGATINLATSMLSDPEGRAMRWQFASGGTTSGAWGIEQDGTLRMLQGRDYEEITKVYALVDEWDYSDPYEPIYLGQSWQWTGARNPSLATQVLNVQAVDDLTGVVKTAALTLTVAPVDEAPSFSSTRTTNSTGGSVIYQGVSEYWVTANRNGGGIIQISGIDPEGLSGFSYSISNVQAAVERIGYYGGNSEIDATAYPSLSISSSGLISFTTPGEGNGGEWEGGVRIDGTRRTSSVEVNFTLNVTDASGLTTSSPFKVIFVRRDTNAPPIAFDLDGDGLELIAYDTSSIHFDMDADGITDQTGWVGGDDGLLALDRNGNGVIDDITEISFAADAAGAQSDLEGLRAYDSDNDGLFDADDTEYGRFLIWRDANQDGISQADELRSLTDWGITSINLSLDLTGQQPGQGGNVIFGTTDYSKSDGTSGIVGDVFLAFTPSNIDALATPIILDYDGDGASLLKLTETSVSFDMDGDGTRDHTGWIEAGDAFLALDRNANGIIDDVREISFTADKAGATTDLEGLAAFDSNGDGSLSALDDRFAAFKLWFDHNSNGVTDAGELLSFAEAEITSISLSGSDASGETASRPNIIYNRTSFTRADGTHGTALDAGIAFERAGEDGSTAIAYAGWSGESEATATPPALPTITMAARIFARKAGKYALEVRDGALFVSAKKAKGAVDARAGSVGAAAILAFSNTYVGLLSPVILDLDGDGIDLKSRKKSRALFDMDGDGVRDDTGWIGKGDGMLVIDRNNDGAITGASEISFLNEKADAKSDLEALAVLDSNRDGKLDATDARFGELKVWVDANGNGVSDEGEVQSLAEHGITAINLSARANSQLVKLGDNVVLATSTFTRADGSVGTVGDVALAFDPSSKRPQANDALAGLRRGLREGFEGGLEGSFGGDALDGNIIRPRLLSTDNAAFLPQASDTRLAHMVQAMAAFGAAPSGEGDSLTVRREDISRHDLFAMS